MIDEEREWAEHDCRLGRLIQLTEREAMALREARDALAAALQQLYWELSVSSRSADATKAKKIDAVLDAHAPGWREK